MKSNATLVGAKRRIELHTEPAIDLNLAFVINPRDTKNDLSLWLAYPLNERIGGVIRMLCNHVPKAFQHFAHSLMELSLASVPAQDFVEDRLKLLVNY